MNCSPELEYFKRHQYPGIYAIECYITGKIYVGRSFNVYKRVKNHKNILKTGKHHNKELQSDFNKYGWSNFHCHLLEKSEELILDKREKYYMSVYTDLYNKSQENMDFEIHQIDNEKFWEKVDIKDEDSCWEWKGAKNGDGYGLFRISGKHYRAHRVSYCIRNGSCDKNLLVRHAVCANRGCVNPQHLKLGTDRDNSRDIMLKENRNSKLSWDNVNYIRKFWFKNQNLTSKVIGDKMSEKFGFRVSSSVVVAILSNNKWISEDWEPFKRIGLFSQDTVDYIMYLRFFQNKKIWEIQNLLTKYVGFRVNRTRIVNICSSCPGFSLSKESKKPIKVTENILAEIISLINSGFAYKDISYQIKEKYNTIIAPTYIREIFYRKIYRKNLS